MLFVLVIPPCFATLSTIKAELGWRWLGFAFVLMLTFGWCLGVAVYQIDLFMGAAAVPARPRGLRPSSSPDWLQGLLAWLGVGGMWS